MRIIPVLDLVNGLAVGGKSGEREAYTPIKSVICDGADPFTLTKAYRAEELYIADLDAIERRGSNLNIIRKIKQETGIFLMVDFGISKTSQIKKLLSHNIDKVILGTETCSQKLFETTPRKFSPQRLLPSIDIKRGEILSSDPTITRKKPVSFAQELTKYGYKEMIVLDLDRVGTQTGISFGLASEMVGEVDAALIMGGGIKTIKDLEQLQKLGFSGALIATAIHTGAISLQELKKFEEIR